MRTSGSGSGGARALATAALGAVLVAGCASIPSAGPTSRQIRRDQARDNQTGFAIVDIDPAIARGMSGAAAGPGALAALAADGRTDALGPGDALAIDIYEVGVTLFAKGGAAAAGNNSFSAAAGGTSIVAVVDAEGVIKLPYVGRIQAAGRSTNEVARAIEQGLSGLSQRPQVTVAVRQNATNTFYILGDVRTPGRLDLGLPRERLLDAIARAGGTTTQQPNDVVVRLTRGDVSAEERLSEIQAGGPADLPLLPGDRIQLFNRPRTFLVFGASDRVSQVPFSASELSLAEAMARTGGPSERIADPAAVYLFRWEPGAAPDAPPRPVVYRLDMTDADSYFMSQQVEMRDKDVIYVASAASNAPAKLTQILGQLFTPIAIGRSFAQ
ncbi:MAG TPA: polysaccharide biosynthesis/export family protein [Sphingomonas sp.]